MATNPRLSVNAMCSYRWPFERDFALWSELGVAHAGALISKLDNDPAAKLAKLKPAGISLSTLILGSYDLSHPDSWNQTNTSHCDAIDLVAECGGRSVYLTPGRTIQLDWNEDLARLVEATAPVIAHGKTKGVSVAFEPSRRTRTSFVHTLADAVDVAERTGLQIVADIGNYWAERDAAATLRRGMPHITLIQICDVAIGSSGERAHIGQGELPMRRMMQDVIDAGYCGVFDLEVVPTDFSAQTDELALRRGILAASTLLDQMGIA